MAEAFYTPEELIEQAENAKTQPEFAPATETDPEDTSWQATQTMIERHDDIATIVAGITQDSEAGITTNDTLETG